MQWIRLLVFLVFGLNLNTMYCKASDSIKVISQQEELVKDKPSLISNYLEDASYYQSINLNLGISNAHKAYRLSKELGDQKLTMDALIQLSKLYMHSNEFKEAETFAKQLIKLSSHLNDQRAYANGILILVKCSKFYGNNDEGAKLSYEALKIFEDINDTLGIVDAYMVIGDVYTEENDYTAAKKYYQTAIKIAQKEGFLVELAIGYSKLGRLYGIYNELETALFCFNKSQKVTEGNAYVYQQFINYSYISYALLKQGELYEAKLYIDSLDILDTESIRDWYSATKYRRKAQYFFAIKDQDSFLKNITKAYNISVKRELFDVEYATVMEIYDYYEKLPNTDSAYKYFKIKSTLREQILSSKRRNELLRQELLYQSEKAEQLKQYEDQKKRIYYYLLVSILLAIIISMFFIISRYKHRIVKAHLKEENYQNKLALQNKEITTGVMESIKKKEILTQITKKLDDLSAKITDEEIKIGINKIVSDIEKVPEEKIWEGFVLRFQKVHSKFYENLLLKYPELTPNEIRICAFLKLNLTTKEMSNLTGQSERALVMARHRLRKKLCLDSSEINLTTFISNI